MSEAGVDSAAGEPPRLARVGPRPPTLAPGERWYCVHTQPRREAFARENLERQGFFAGKYHRALPFRSHIRAVYRGRAVPSPTKDEGNSR